MPSAKKSTKSMRGKSEMNNIVAYSPVKLTSSDLNLLQSHLKSQHNISAPITSKIDSSLIAGVKILYQDKELDYSLLGKLHRLTKELEQ